MNTRTYYAAKCADGTDTSAQRRKYGTPSYGFKTVQRALVYTPAGGYVEERHCDKTFDWGGRIVAHKPAQLT